ncbi:hypothetical protein MOD31_04435 [Paenarthrobacter sp. TYUT067]|uniref:hypothetical protein n=1 Tax=Paenarthrobacter sp. TYUT067 TaxID=2926245 RepID=UPI00202E6CEF|nr:hypothetical protein [Paenarthrobacter sp. TYUT067]MCM0615260.1 hypothetical protein [Paenarthrobacter sp. TYUT067]
MKKRGMSVHVDELLPASAFKRKNGNILDRLFAGSVLLGRLFLRIIVISRPSDILIVHREAFPFFTPVFERIAAKRSGMAILDIDDAVYADPTHRRDWRRILRNPVRALEYKDMFDVILCGNDVLLGDFDNGKATVVYAPTCPPVATFDTIRRPSDPRILMWTGSQSTLGSLQKVLPQVLDACESHDLVLHVLGGANISELPKHPRIRAQLWSAEAEMELLGRASLGLMPLPDTEWERGKSGYKAILYLCAGLPSVISPVGINRRLAEEYESISACNDNDWTATIARALESSNAYNGLVSTNEDSSQALARGVFHSSDNASRTVDSVLSQATL